METKAIIIKPNALGNIAEGYLECFGHAQALLLAEEHEHLHYALPILRDLQKVGIKATSHTFKRASFAKIFPLIEERAVVPIFFGDHRLISVGKRVCYKLSRSYAAIPTTLMSPEMSSPWRLTWPGLFVPSQSPTLLLVDTKLIKEPQLPAEGIAEALFLLTRHGEAYLFGEENLRKDLHSLAFASATEFFTAFLDKSKYSVELLAKALAQGGVADQDIEYPKTRNRRVPISLIALATLYLAQQLTTFAVEDTVGRQRVGRADLIRGLFLEKDQQGLPQKSFVKRPPLKKVQAKLEANLPSYDAIKTKLKESGCITSVEEAHCGLDELADELLRIMIRTSHLGVLDYYDEVGLLHEALLLLEGM
ncbi:MAG: hypothetical protein WCY61_05675 [Sphaerochaeta sp.]